MSDQPVHGTVVARPGPTGWRGLLLRGPSGAGKSDLALRLMGEGWRLVADDYAHLWASTGALYAASPETIAGRIEARGLGIVSAPTRSVARIVVVVDCVQAVVERLPEPAFETLAGVRIPRLALDIRPASATRTLVLAMDHL